MNGNWRKRIGFGLVVAFILAAVTGGLAQIAFYQKIVLTGPCQLSAGSGTPEGAVTGSPCDLFLRTNGGAGTILYIKETGSATNTGWAAVPPGGTIGVTAGGTGITSYAVGDLIYASAATTLSKLADVAAGSYLRSGGVTTAPLWSTMTLPNTVNSGDILRASAANTVTGLAFTDGYILTANASGPKWSRDAWTEFQQAGRCQGASAITYFSIPSGVTAPTVSCDTGTYQNRGTLDFTDGSNHTSQASIHLGDDYDSAGATSLAIYWKTTATTGDAIWAVKTACSGTGEATDVAWNAAQNITSAALGTGGLKIKASQASLTMTGCAADETLFIKIDRDGTVGGDTIAATAVLVGIEIKYYRKWT